MTNDSRYPVPAEERRLAEEIKGSRFIATVTHAPDVDAARSFVQRVKREFSDATHNCWAYVVGPPGSTAETGSSDDGEPGGTAGLPILTVLLNSGVGDVAVVVTRYFGGVKLGRGGLARAYGGGAQRVLAELPLAEWVFCVHMRVTVDYPAVDAVRRHADAHGGKVTGETFAEAVTFEVEVPEDRVNGFEKDIAEATGGKVVIKRMKHSRDEGQRR
jgi:uncharacterized YigZ family protein